VATKKKKKSTFSKTALILIWVALVVVLGVEIVKVYGKLSDAKENEIVLAQQEQQLIEDNETLREDLQKADDENFIKSLARALGWYEDGIRLFVDPSR